MSLRRTKLSLLLLIMSLPLISGCVTLGPRTKTTIVTVEVGKPVVIVENKKVKVTPLNGDGSEIGKVDVGGWVAMPKAHFDYLKKRANE